MALSSVAASAVLPVLLLASGPAAFKSLQTQGSVRIQEAAGVTMLSEAPLQLLLSSDFGVSTGAASRDGSTGDAGPGRGLAVADGGLFASIANPGEVLSVSVGDTEITVEHGGGKKLKRIIAQFN